MKRHPNESYDTIRETAEEIAAIFALLGWVWARSSDPETRFVPTADDIERTIRLAISAIEVDRLSGNPKRDHWSSGRISVDRESSGYDPDYDVRYSIGLVTEIGNVGPDEIQIPTEPKDVTP